MNSKSKLFNSLRSEVGINWRKSFIKSEENKLRSLNAYNVLGKRKYLNLRKANKQANFQGHSVSNFISYKELAQVIYTIDIATVKNLSDLCSDYKTSPAVYRDPDKFFILI